MSFESANFPYDMTRLEMVGVDDGAIEWSGPVDDFDIDQLGENELSFLMANKYVVVGGGAAPVFCVRFAKAVPVA